VLKFLLGIVGGAAVLYIVVRGAMFYSETQAGSELARRAVAFQSDHPGTTLLVLGDSTGVGVGASQSEDSIPARMAEALSIGTVENRAVSGAQVHDLAAQIAAAKLPQYDYILILIGGNDIIRFHDASSTSALLREELQKLSKSKRVLIVCAANVGGAMIFPLPLRWYYERLNLQYHARFAEVASSLGYTYVNLYRPKSEDVFVQEPERYTAKDRLHPSSEGYRVWWERIKKTLEESQ
jgi:lysophospholipase L1-like esterase